MIIKAEMIEQPISGQYKEKIYNISSTWNSQNWTWIKFVNHDLTEWCGHFRGLPKNAVISKKYKCALILTSDYLLKLDCFTGEIIEYESQPQYQSLTVTPFGDFLVADYYNIYIIQSSLEDKKEIKISIKIDMIKFGAWKNNLFSIYCDEFLNWDNHMELELNSETFEITIKNSNKYYK
ncbi:MAG: hypothetical protein AB7V48_04075 [Sedimentibacter sp.]